MFQQVSLLPTCFCQRNSENNIESGQQFTKSMFWRISYIIYAYQCIIFIRCVIPEHCIPDCMRTYAEKHALPRSKQPQLITSFWAKQHLFTTNMLRFLISCDYVCTNIDRVYQFATAKPFAAFIEGKFGVYVCACVCVYVNIIVYYAGELRKRCAASNANDNLRAAQHKLALNSGKFIF